ncbi:hypothetical protein K1719_025216 [Acacia pycnantha]|nr:hypothetical protein K1719_025216 [Acacia pycnantha]
MASNQQGATANTPVKRKSMFVKVDQLKPGTNGHNLVVKVVSANTVLQKGRPSTSSQNPRPTLIAECLIGDETGTILFTARNEQVKLAGYWRNFSGYFQWKKQHEAQWSLSSVEWSESVPMEATNQ